MRKIIEINRRKVEVSEVGDGSQVVLFEAGLGGTIEDYAELCQNLSKDFRVITYNRPGYGESEIIRDGKWEIDDVVDNMIGVLESLEIEDKVIIAAHSFGGACTQKLLMRYPHKVSGVVLIDASPLNYAEVEKTKRECLSIHEKYDSDRILSGMFEKSRMSNEELRELDITESPDMFYAMASEFLSLRESNVNVSNMGEELNLDLPLKVMVRDEDIEVEKLLKVGIPKDEALNFEKKLQECIKLQTGISKKAELIICKGSDHPIHKNLPQRVIQAIKSVADEI